MKTFIILLRHPFYEKLVRQTLFNAERLGWNINVFFAINGNDVTNDTWKNYEIFWSNHRPQDNLPGVFGCFLSHWTLWNKCIEINEPIIIVEHDVDIDCEWQNINLHNVEILKLFTSTSQMHYVDDVSGNWAVGAHAYCITPLGANKLINFVKENGAFAVDVLMGDNIIDVKYSSDIYINKHAIGFSNNELYVYDRMSPGASFSTTSNLSDII